MSDNALVLRTKFQEFAYMGNTTSSNTISVDELKNQLFGSAVFLLAPKLDSTLRFRRTDEITENDSHVLPFAVSRDLMEVVKGYYNGGQNPATDAAVERYVVNHVLDSPEHLNQFIQAFITSLRSGGSKQIKPHHTTHSRRTSQPEPEPKPEQVVEVEAETELKQESVPEPELKPERDVEVSSRTATMSRSSRHGNAVLSKTSDHIDRKLKQLNSAIHRERRNALAPRPVSTSTSTPSLSSRHASVAKPELDESELVPMDQATNEGEYEQESN